MKTSYPKTGDKVSGDYYGIRFSGVITSERWIAGLTDVEFLVQLDAPIFVFGTHRNAILLRGGEL